MDAVFAGIVALTRHIRPLLWSVTSDLRLHAWQWRELERELRDYGGEG